MNSFKELTELPGQKASKEQLSRMYTRYKFASEFCGGKKVLEIACGGGFGLGMLSEKSKELVAGDIDEKILEYPRMTFKDNKKIKIINLDANQKLPFKDKSFDVIILFEALYYLKTPELFAKEAKRVLRKEGLLILSFPNKEIEGFHPSPSSFYYYSDNEIYSILTRLGFEDVKIYGNCGMERSLTHQITIFIKKMAVKFNFIPQNLKDREKYKRIFFGKLEEIPKELKEGMFEYLPLAELDYNKINKDYKILFAIAKKK